MTKTVKASRGGWIKRRPAPGTRKNPKASEAMKAMWASPEGKEKMVYRAARVAEERAADPLKFTRTGIPTGMTKKTVAPLIAKATAQADRYIQKMKDEGVLPSVVIPDSDEARAEAALREACVLALGPTEKAVKISAIRAVLEWTRSKPESKSKMTINTSEQWLAQIAADDAGSE